MISRNIVSLGIWLASTAGAYWLARGDSGVADAPAQILPQEFRIAAAETGRLIEIHATVGQRVRTGDLLARLDTSVLEREIATSEAHLRQLKTEPGASSASMEFDGYASERSFQSDVDESSAQLEAARAVQAQQVSELKALSEEIRRQRLLVKEGLTRADRVEELEVRAKSIADLATTWPSRIAAIEERQRAALVRLQEWRAQHKPSSAPESREARLKPLVERIAEQQEALRILRARLAAARISAPVDGEVILATARQGDVATAGVPFLIIHGVGPRMLVAYVNERTQLWPGAQAIARRRTSAREEFPTTVSRVADAIIQLPPRFWLIPTIPQWGREVYLELPEPTPLNAGEALDIKFVTGGPR